MFEMFEGVKIKKKKKKTFRQNKIKIGQTRYDVFITLNNLMFEGMKKKFRDKIKL